MSLNYSHRIEDEEEARQEPFLDKQTTEHPITKESVRLYQGRCFCLRFWQWLRLIIEVGLVVAVVLLLRASNATQLLGDETGYVPSFSSQVVVFQPQPQFISNHSSIDSLTEAQRHWEAFYPPGQGYVWIHDADAYTNLPHMPDNEHTLSISVIHSVHCLWSIMAEFDLVKLGLAQPNRSTAHFDHCLDWLRQELTCAGDTSMAGWDLPDGSSHWNVPHVCKNWHELYTWQEKNRLLDGWLFGEGRAEDYFTAAPDFNLPQD